MTKRLNVYTIYYVSSVPSVQCCSCFVETWILYSGDGQEVSRSVQDAYRKYGNKEFGTKNCYMHKDNMNRHVKLINITDKEVNFSSVNLFTILV